MSRTGTSSDWLAGSASLAPLRVLCALCGTSTFSAKYAKDPQRAAKESDQVLPNYCRLRANERRSKTNSLLYYFATGSSMYDAEFFDREIRWVAC